MNPFRWANDVAEELFARAGRLGQFMPGRLAKVVACMAIVAAFGALWALQGYRKAESRQEREDITRYYRITIDGKPTGIRKVAVRNVNELTSTQVSEVLYARREGSIVRMFSQVTYEEWQGRPIAFEMVEQKSGAVVRVKGCIEGDEIEITRRQGHDDVQGPGAISRHRWDADVLFPSAVTRAYRAHGDKAGNTYVIKAYSPRMNLYRPTEVRVRVVGPERIAIGGQVRMAAKMAYTVAGQNPNEQFDWLDSEGEVLKSQMRVGLVEIVLSQCSVDEARGLDLANAADAFDDKMGLKVVGWAPEARAACRMTIEIPRKSGNLLLAWPQSSSQTVTEHGDLLRFEIVRPLEPQDRTVTPGKHLEANNILDWRHPCVQSLVRDAKVSGGDPWIKAKELAAFVHGRMGSSSMGVGFAPASEVARTLQGDCTEHAVLLAAMLRATGIPSRVVLGFVAGEMGPMPQESTWKLHMWTQARVGCQWRDLDSSAAEGSAGFGRIAVGASTLSDFELSALTLQALQIAEGGARLVSWELPHQTGRE